MFKFLKDKLKKAVSIFSKKVEEEAEIKEEVREIPKEEFKVPKEKIKEEKISKAKEVPEEPVHITDEVEEAEAEEPKADENLKEEKPEEEALPEFEEEIEGVEEPEKEKTKEEIESQLKDLKEDIEKKFKEVKPASQGLADSENKGFLKPEPETSKQKLAVPEKSSFSEIKEEEKHEKPSFFQKIFGKKEKHEEISVEIKGEKPKEEIVEERKPEIKEIEKEVKVKKEKELLVAAGAEKEEIEEEPETSKQKLAVPEEPSSSERKRGFFGRIKETLTTVKLSEEKFEKLFWELEVVLMENNVAVEVIDKIKSDLREELTTGKVSRKGIEGLVEDSLRESIESLFIDKHFNLIEEARKKKTKPYIVAFIGVNGSGKTTTMAKIASLLLKNNLSVVFAASDTFRAAAIQQLQEHADKLGVKMIRHEYESDPAAVAFDAIQHAKAKGIDVVLIDTAGRLHVNDNLMNELKKLIRVNKPDLKIFVGESITGNDCVEQAQLFNEAVGIDAIILAKADVDEKGGAAVSVGYVTKKPIIYLGTGQKYEDLQEFKPEIIIKNIGL
jgi:fused signal recognition particle receptor